MLDTHIDLGDGLHKVRYYSSPNFEYYFINGKHFFTIELTPIGSYKFYIFI